MHLIAEEVDAAGRLNRLMVLIVFSIARFNPVALRKAKIVCNFGLSECNMVNCDLLFEFQKCI